ncbi:hypothetical protein BDF22DRAFT_664553 [Syncephalis plumigaleata]|nr:hypothetical protein BDF22DRAFT_664553 [Syncephalis plumigaleata]
MESNATIVSPVYNGLDQLKLPTNQQHKQCPYAFQNTWKAVKLLRSRPANKSYWCCFIQAFYGVIVGMGGIAMMLSSTITCQILIWIVMVGLATSSVCSVVCLLAKAYAVQMRSKRVLWFGIMCIPLPTISVWGFAFSEDVYFTNDGICMINVPNWVSIARSCIDVFINGVFSCIFLRAAIKQYQAFGSNCWSKLKSDGLFYMLCVAVSNVVCAVIIVSQLFGPISETVFFVDWVVVSTLLVHQYQNMRTALQDNRPKTRQYTFLQMQ